MKEVWLIQDRAGQRFASFEGGRLYWRADRLKAVTFGDEISAEVYARAFHIAEGYSLKRETVH